MGHYRSEMGYEAEDAREEAQKKKKRERTAQAIKQAMEDEGLEYVLADILTDPVLARIRFCM